LKFAILVEHEGAAFYTRTCLPYMFFCLITQTVARDLLASESKAKGRVNLALKFSCDLRLSRETPPLAVGLLEFGVKVAELLRSVVQPRVVLGKNR